VSFRESITTKIKHFIEIKQLCKVALGVPFNLENEAAR